MLCLLLRRAQTTSTNLYDSLTQICEELPDGLQSSWIALAQICEELPDGDESSWIGLVGTREAY